jgi:hypothetical protein
MVTRDRPNNWEGTETQSGFILQTHYQIPKKQSITKHQNLQTSNFEFFKSQTNQHCENCNFGKLSISELQNSQNKKTKTRMFENKIHSLNTTMCAIVWSMQLRCPCCCPEGASPTKYYTSLLCVLLSAGPHQYIYGAQTSDQQLGRVRSTPWFVNLTPNVARPTIGNFKILKLQMPNNRSINNSIF